MTPSQGWCKNLGRPEPGQRVLGGDFDRYRKVFEVIGPKTECAFADDQISGVGLTNGRKDSVAVVVDGRRAYALSF